MKKEIKKVKIRLKVGKIYTLTIEKETDEHIAGYDLYGDYVRINKEEIDTLYPLRDRSGK